VRETLDTPLLSRTEFRLAFWIYAGIAVLTVISIAGGERVAVLVATLTAGLVVWFCLYVLKVGLLSAPVLEKGTWLLTLISRDMSLREFPASLLRGLSIGWRNPLQENRKICD
jgi:hypothetical protein